MNSPEAAGASPELKSARKSRLRVRVPFGRCDPRGIVVFWWTLAWTLGLLGSGWFPANASPDPSEQEDRQKAVADEHDTVECPRCGGKGKTDCSECGGRGEIYRVCEICKGAGKKPCPVCTKPDPAGGAASPPGTLRCGYCGGRGSSTDGGRVCPRCQGAGVTTCPACAGSGSVSCRTEVFVRVCPRCRFTGKEPCPTCGGAGVVARSVALGERATESPNGSAREKSTSSSASTPQLSASAEGGSREAGPSFAEAKARYDRLAPHCEMHYDVFVEDLTPKADRVRSEAREWARKLELAGAEPSADLIHQLGKVVDRAESFRKRWQDLRGLLQEEHRSYSNAKRTLELREEAVNGAKGTARLRMEDHWNDRFDLVVRILEKNVTPLLEDDPTWLAREITSLETTWDQLKATVEKESELLVKLRSERKDPESTAPKKNGTGSDDATEDSETSAPASDHPPGDADGGASGTDPSAGTAVSSDLARVARDVAAGNDPRRTVVQSTDPVSEAGSRYPDPEAPSVSTEPAESHSGDSGFVWAVVGFLAATALFVVGSRLRRRQD